MLWYYVLVQKEACMSIFTLRVDEYYFLFRPCSERERVNVSERKREREEREDKCFVYIFVPIIIVCIVYTCT